MTTQDPNRQKALVVTDKSERVFNFHNETLKALKEIVEAAGLTHPIQIDTSHVVRRLNANEVRLLSELLPAIPAGSLLRNEEGSNLPRLYQTYWDLAQANSFAPLKT